MRLWFLYIFMTSAPLFWNFPYFLEDFASMKSGQDSCDCPSWTTPSGALRADLVQHGLLHIKYLLWSGVFYSKHGAPGLYLEILTNLSLWPTSIFFFVLLVILLLFFNWRKIVLQYCIGFCCTRKWISHYIDAYAPSLLSLLPPPISLASSRSSQSTELSSLRCIQQLPTSYLV